MHDALMKMNNSHTLYTVDEDIVIEAKEILGDKFQQLVEGYINDTKSMLMTMDIDRATGMTENVGKTAHSLKSSSHQVGARLVSLQAAELEKFIRDHINTMDEICFHKQVESMIGQLQNNFYDYQMQIKRYL